ncbi:MAG: hypothetical protein IT445_16040 [Phycisphaeraceae bacterium]|nr:hypothetical protein [Phycisphaeraceae bacterium]
MGHVFPSGGRLILLLIFMLSAATASAAERTSKQNNGWEWAPLDIETMRGMARSIEQRDRGYLLAGAGWWVWSDVSSEFTVQVAYYLQRFEQLFSQIAPLAGRPIDPAIPRVMFFERQLAYKQMIANRDASGHAEYRWDTDRITEIGFATRLDQYQQKDFDRLNRATLQHEAVHCLLQKSLGPHAAPSWFHEGHAEYFERWDPRQTVNENRHRLFLRNATGPVGVEFQRSGQLPSIIEALNLQQASDMFGRDGGHDSHYYYDLTRSLMETLLNDPEGIALYQKLFERLRQDEPVLITQEEAATLQTRWHQRLRDAIRAAEQEKAQEDKRR